MNRNEKREAEFVIKRELHSGKTKSEILEEMSKNRNDKLALGKLIASIPNPIDRKRYKPLNNFLILLLSLLLLANVYEGYLMYGEEPFVTIIASLVLLLISIYFFHGLVKFKGNIYAELTQLLVLVIIVELNRIGGLNIWILAQTILIVLNLVVAIIIRRKVFPYYGFFGLKKRKDGYYQVD